MMAIEEDKEEMVQVGVRMQRWLKDEIAEDAKKSGWDFSKQIRNELLSLRGKEQKLYLPSAAQS